MTKKIWALLALPVPLLALARPASAATPTYYVDRTTFQSALGNTVLDDYSNPGYVFNQNNASMTAVLHETIYETTAFNNLNFVINNGNNDFFYCSGCNGSFRLTFTATTVGTPAGVFGVGVDVRFNSGDFAFITFGDETTDNVLVDSTFFAVSAPELVKSIHFGLSGGGRRRTSPSGSATSRSATEAFAATACRTRASSATTATRLNGDGCSSTCKIEFCGNGVIDPGEVCDDGNT